VAGKKGRIPQVVSPTGRHISSDAVSAAQRTPDKENPSFRFGYADLQNYCLHHANTEQIEALVKALAKMERYTWEQVRTSGGQGQHVGGLGYKPVEPTKRMPRFPSDLPEDATIHEIRVTQRMRLFGYREDTIFYIIWFDPDHAIFPERNR